MHQQAGRVKRPARCLGATLPYGLTAMSPATTEIRPFTIKDSALIRIATAMRRELRDRPALG